MSTTTEQDAPAAAPARKPLGRRILVLLVLLLVSAAALAGGLAVSMGPKAFTTFLLSEESAEAPAQAEGPGKTAIAGHGTAGAHGPAASSLVITPFKEIITNITSTTATGRHTTRFLKLNVALAYDDKAEGADRVEARKLYMRDSFQDYLRQMTERDLQGTIGLVTLKAELLRRARAITESEAPREILISDLIVQ